MHPESKIEELERMLVNLQVQNEKIEEVVQEFLSGGVEVIGIRSRDIVDSVIMAIDNTDKT